MNYIKKLIIDEIKEPKISFESRGSKDIKDSKETKDIKDSKENKEYYQKVLKL